MSSEGFTNACARSGGSKRKPQSSWNPVSGEREDVVQLDVEAVCTADRELRDPVALLEAQHELLAGVISRVELVEAEDERRKSTRLNSSHVRISYAVFCLKKK